MRRLPAGLAAAAALTILLLPGVPAAAQRLPAPPTAARGADTLTQLLDHAGQAKGVDLDRELNTQMDKAMARDAARGGKPASGDSLETSLDKALDHAAERSGLHAETPKGDAQAGAAAAKPAAKVPGAQDVSEEDLRNAYTQVGQTVKQVRRPAAPSATTVIVAILGAGLMLALGSVGAIRFLARRTLAMVEDAEYGPGPARAPDVRYSWYYRDAVARAPARPSRRR